MSDDFDPWGSSNKPKGPKKPNGGKKPTGGGGKRPEPDLDEVLKKFKKNTENMFGGSGDNKKGLIFLVVAALFLYIASGSIFLVGTQEEGVVLRFGKFHKTVGDGVNFKFPEPIDRAFVFDVEGIREVTIGLTADEALMVTGDENIAEVQFEVFWKINNLNDFLFKVKDSQYAVKSAAESAMREVVGNMPIAIALGEGQGRTRITDETQELLQQMLSDYGTGIQIVSIKLKKVDVPPQVVDAQIDVQNAKTEQQKLKNEAETYRNKIIPVARGDAAKLTQAAEAYKQTVVANSEGEASRFLAIYQEYRKAKDVTKKRMYLETMQEIMAGMDKVILENKSGVLPYLPLDGLRTSSGKTGESK